MDELMDIACETPRATPVKRNPARHRSNRKTPQADAEALDRQSDENNSSRSSTDAVGLIRTLIITYRREVNKLTEENNYLKRKLEAGGIVNCPSCSHKFRHQANLVLPKYIKVLKGRHMVEMEFLSLDKLEEWLTLNSFEVAAGGLASLNKPEAAPTLKSCDSQLERILAEEANKREKVRIPIAAKSNDQQKQDDTIHSSARHGSTRKGKHMSDADKNITQRKETDLAAPRHKREQDDPNFESEDVEINNVEALRRSPRKRNQNTQEKENSEEKITSRSTGSRKDKIDVAEKHSFHQRKHEKSTSSHDAHLEVRIENTGEPLRKAQMTTHRKHNVEDRDHAKLDVHVTEARSSHDRINDRSPISADSRENRTVNRPGQPFRIPLKVLSQINSTSETTQKDKYYSRQAEKDRSSPSTRTTDGHGRENSESSIRQHQLDDGKCESNFGPREPRHRRNDSGQWDHRYRHADEKCNLSVDEQKRVSRYRHADEKRNVSVDEHSRRLPRRSASDRRRDKLDDSEKAYSSSSRVINRTPVKRMARSPLPRGSKRGRRSFGSIPTGRRRRSDERNAECSDIRKSSARSRLSNDSVSPMHTPGKEDNGGAHLVETDTSGFELAISARCPIISVIHPSPTPSSVFSVPTSVTSRLIIDEDVEDGEVRSDDDLEQMDVTPNQTLTTPLYSPFASPPAAIPRRNDPNICKDGQEVVVELVISNPSENEANEAKNNDALSNLPAEPDILNQEGEGDPTLPKASSTSPTGSIYEKTRSLGNIPAPAEELNEDRSVDQVIMENDHPHQTINDDPALIQSDRVDSVEPGLPSSYIKTAESDANDVGLPTPRTFVRPHLEMAPRKTMRISSTSPRSPSSSDESEVVLEDETYLSDSPSTSNEIDACEEPNKVSDRERSSDSSCGSDFDCFGGVVVENEEDIFSDGFEPNSSDSDDNRNIFDDESDADEGCDE